jgi:hypothetical protein
MVFATFLTDNTSLPLNTLLLSNAIGALCLLHIHLSDWKAPIYCSPQQYRTQHTAYRDDFCIFKVA